MSHVTADSFTACYSVTTDSEPGVLPRLLGHLAKIGVVPTRVHATTADEELHVDLQVTGLDANRAALLEQRFATTVGVLWVAYSSKGVADGSSGFWL
ncbi:hypothetical protein [Novispirillum itersonii]|uniref:ACT domain-containing protein n=1 Tax=Novispirillum itersonii TaxID=189 RepID=A0A7W9ZCR7_NOVIT|nr:hypothetical protein [Novispirillum itersonii]MBB6209078.1 hypothetical protein [Novispirillum itersonii]